MKKAMRDKWVKALRSKKYKQANGYLHYEDDNSFCCLGVLCDVNGLTTEQMHGMRNGTADRGALISRKWLKEFGLPPAVAGALADLNDDGKPFPDIAKAILEQVPLT